MGNKSNTLPCTPLGILSLQRHREHLFVLAVSAAAPLNHGGNPHSESALPTITGEIRV